MHKKVPCTEQEFRDFYRNVDRLWKKERSHGRCMCPKKFIWACDGDCENCEHHAGYGELSLEAPNTEGGKPLQDTLPDTQICMEKVIEDRLLLEQLFTRLRELDPDADCIFQGGRIVGRY